ncbi:MAG: DUF3303 domain-containing protein [Nitrososphaerales archaeon]
MTCVSSWVDHKLGRRCWVMEAEGRALLDQWTANWPDAIDVEAHPVLSSKEAAERVAPLGL